MQLNSTAHNYATTFNFATGCIQTAAVCNYAKEYKWSTCTRPLLCYASQLKERVQSRGVVLQLILSVGSQSSAAVLQGGDIWSSSKFRTWTQTKWPQTFTANSSRELRLDKSGWGLLRLMSNWCQAGSCHSTQIKLADLCAPDISIWYDTYDCFLQQTRFEINVNTPISLFFQFPKEDSFGLAGYLRKWGFPPPGSSKLTSQSGILWAPKRSLCLTKECKRVMAVLARIW